MNYNYLSEKSKRKKINILKMKKLEISNPFQEICPKIPPISKIKIITKKIFLYSQK